MVPCAETKLFTIPLCLCFFLLSVTSIDVMEHFLNNYYSYAAKFNCLLEGNAQNLLRKRSAILSTTCPVHVIRSILKPFDWLRLFGIWIQLTDLVHSRPIAYFVASTVSHILFCACFSWGNPFILKVNGSGLRD